MKERRHYHFGHLVLGCMILFFFIIAISPFIDSKPVNARSERRSTPRGFSVFSGENVQLRRAILDSMHDPDSYEHVETRYWNQGDRVVVVTKFRGNNPLGAKIVNHVMAECDTSGNLVEIVNQW